MKIRREALHARWQPFAFSGVGALGCSVGGATSPDYTVRAGRGRWRAQALVLDSAADAGRADAGLCMVLQGDWQADGAALIPGQGLWWSAPQPDPQQLVPQTDDARLVQVLLQAC